MGEAKRMIFYQVLHENVINTGWMPYYGIITAEKDFKNRKYLINRIEYTKWTPEFREAYQADLMWDKLGEIK